MTTPPVPIFCGLCGLKTWHNYRCWNPGCGLRTPNFTAMLTERKTTCERRN